MADLRIVDAPVLLQESITDDVKMPTGGLGNFSVRLGDISWYVITKEQLANKNYVDLSSKGVKDSLDEHIANKANPHQVTKTQVGLSNVDNTADIDKPISNAVSSAIITATTDMATKAYVNSKDGDLTTLTTTDKTSLVKAINEVVSVKADKATTLEGYGITDTYTKSQIDNDYGGVKALYNKNIELGSGANGWVASLVQDANGKNQQQINDVTVQTVESVADLRSLQTAKDGQMVIVKSYHVGLNIGGGEFVWNTASTATVDDGIVFAIDGVAIGRWIRQLEDYVTPEMFGARGDGVTDDTQSLTRCFNTNHHTIFLENKYLTKSQINVGEGTLKVFGSNSNTSGIFTDVGLSIILNASKSNPYTYLESLGQDMGEGQIRLTLSENYGIKNRDLISIIDTDVSSFSESRTYYHKGEILDVEEVQDKTLVLHSVPYMTYTSKDSTKLYKANYKLGFILKDLTIYSTVYNSGSTVVNIEYQKDAIISNVKTSGLKYANIVVKNSYNVTIENSIINQHLPASQTVGLEYGVAIINSQFTKVVNCNVAALRHGVSQGGSGVTPNNLCPNLVLGTLVEGCIIYGKSLALDAHGNAAYYKFINNHVNGISCNTNGSIISGNHIRTKSTIGIHLGSESNFVDCVVSNNMVSNYLNRPLAVGYGDFVEDYNGKLLITGNSFYKWKDSNNTEDMRFAIYYEERTYLGRRPVKGKTTIEFSSNSIVCENSRVTSSAYFTSKVGGSIMVTNNDIKSSGGIVCQDFQDTEVISNRISTVEKEESKGLNTNDYVTIFCRTNGDNNFIRVSGNIINSPYHHSIYVDTLNSIGECFEITNNVIRNPNTYISRITHPIYVINTLSNQSEVKGVIKNNRISGLNESFRTVYSRGTVDIDHDYNHSVVLNEDIFRGNYIRSNLYEIKFAPSMSNKILKGIVDNPASSSCKIPVGKSIFMRFTEDTTLGVIGVTTGSNLYVPGQSPVANITVTAGTMVEFKLTNNNRWSIRLL